MEKATDWIALWRQLVEAHQTVLGAEADPWRGKAHDFDARSEHRHSKTDLLRDFIASRLGPADTLLDIGAGTGHWSIHMARRARRVTAVEPSEAMVEVLRKNLAQANAANVDVVEGRWPEVAVEAHDVVLCSHAMYFSADLPAFIDGMVAASRRLCCLVLRLPALDGVMPEAAGRLWGQPHDSPNFIVAYNALLQLGLRPNVLVDPKPWRPWVSPTLDAALAKIKSRFSLPELSEHDGYLRDLLLRRLAPSEGQYVWPVGVYSALETQPTTLVWSADMV